MWRSLLYEAAINLRAERASWHHTAQSHIIICSATVAPLWRVAVKVISKHKLRQLKSVRACLLWKNMEYQQYKDYRPETKLCGTNPSKQILFTHITDSDNSFKINLTYTYNSTNTSPTVHNANKRSDLSGESCAFILKVVRTDKNVNSSLESQQVHKVRDKN